MLKRFARWVLRYELADADRLLRLAQNNYDLEQARAGDWKRKFLNRGREIARLHEIIDTYRQGRAVELKDAAFAGRIRTGNGTVIDTALTYDEIAVPGSVISLKREGDALIVTGGVYHLMHATSGGGVSFQLK